MTKNQFRTAGKKEALPVPIYCDIPWSTFSDSGKDLLKHIVEKRPVAMDFASLKWLILYTVQHIGIGSERQLELS